MTGLNVFITDVGRKVVFQPSYHSFGAYNIKYRRNEKENDE